MILLLSFSSCQKDELASKSEKARTTIQDVSSPAETKPENASQAQVMTVSNCRCEYQIMEAEVESPTMSEGTQEHYLIGGDGESCSESDCFYFWGREGSCQMFPECVDIFSTYPSSFFPFECDPPAFSSFNIAWVPYWVEAGCTFVEAEEGHIKFRLRCQDLVQSTGCIGYGYYSNEAIISIAVKPHFGPLVDATLGGQCGCVPRLTVLNP